METCDPYTAENYGGWFVPFLFFVFLPGFIELRKDEKTSRE